MKRQEQVEERYGIQPSRESAGIAPNMQSISAHVTNLAGASEEIALLFGMNQAWHSDQEEVTVQLTDRIVQSPFVAKRMAVLLQNVIRDYESRYGELDIGIRRPAGTPPISQKRFELDFQF